MPTNKQIDARVDALEAWKTTVDSKLASYGNRIAALEAASGGTVDLTAIEARLTTLENKICPHQDPNDPTTFESRLKVLELDHIPD